MYVLELLCDAMLVFVLFTHSYSQLLMIRTNINNCFQVLNTFTRSADHMRPFERNKDFLNDFAPYPGYPHIQKNSCEEVAKLLAEIKTCKHCNGGEVPDIIGALDHLEDDHHHVSVRGTLYVCALCNVGLHLVLTFVIMRC